MENTTFHKSSTKWAAAAFGVCNGHRTRRWNRAQECRHRRVPRLARKLRTASKGAFRTRQVRVSGNKASVCAPQGSTRRKRRVRHHWTPDHNRVRHRSKRTHQACIHGRWIRQPKPRS